jgi:adenylyltransferase/sulfurtransferase
MSSLSVAALKTALDTHTPLTLVDVREQNEWDFCRLPQAKLIPLTEFQQRAPHELSPENKIVLYCHHGMRSAHAQAYLQQLGFTHTFNLIGGIDAWAKEIDSTMPRY